MPNNLESKSIYLVDEPKNINPITKFYSRLEKLNYDRVNSTTKKLDVIVINKELSRSTEEHAKLDKRIAKLNKKFSPQIMSLNDFLNLIGYDPDPRFVLWTDQYPNFDPWTGEPVRMWKG